jgi:hypothetical protein
MAAQDTFSSAVDRFLRYLASERGASPLTLKSYREDLLQLEEFLTSAGCRRPGDASSTLLRRFAGGLHAAGYAQSTIARKLASMRSFYAFGQREGWVQANPAKPLRSPKLPRKLPKFLTGEEISRLLAAPKPAAAGGLMRLPRLLPQRIAMEMALTGDMYGAERLAAYGLFNAVVEPGQALHEARQLARRIMANAPLSVAASKRVIVEQRDWPISEMFERQEPITAPVLASLDAREGAAAFAQRRPPQWRGQ